MAITVLESFDEGIAGYLGSPAPSTSYGYHDKGVRLGDNTGGGLWMVQPNPLVMGFWVYPVLNGGGAIFISFLSVFNSGSLRYDPTNERLYVYTGSASGGTAYYYSPIGSVPNQTWHYVELMIDVGTSNDGAVDFWLDGVLLHSDTGVDWQYSAGTTLAIGTGDSAAADDFYLDDLYLASTTGGGLIACTGKINEVRLLRPSGNGTTSALVGSDGNSTDNDLLVDEDPMSMTDYVESDTEGDLDTYAMPDLASGETPLAVEVVSYAQKDDASAKAIRPIIRSGSTDYAGTTVAVAEAPTLQKEIWEVDPNTSTAWTLSGVNAMEVGVEVRDS